MIKLDPDCWRLIHARLVDEYPASVMLIRSRMREVLGFTVREHQQWKESGKSSDGRAYGHMQTCIYLDFYNDAMESWFQLKYM
jgi:hypothetical protein